MNLRRCSFTHCAFYPLCINLIKRLKKTASQHGGDKWMFKIKIIRFDYQKKIFSSGIVVYESILHIFCKEEFSFLLKKLIILKIPIQHINLVYSENYVKNQLNDKCRQLQSSTERKIKFWIISEKVWEIMKQHISKLKDIIFIAENFSDRFHEHFLSFIAWKRRNCCVTRCNVSGKENNYLSRLFQSRWPLLHSWPLKINSTQWLWLLRRTSPSKCEAQCKT